ncbi:hypothetical protein ILUMI_04661 [Ignelater luminosus]|uniref:Coiled-coil domain-containing protein 167 n=1 Tax=Ignelater luminosus TaxID=2038154 RepID=A0A8K0D8I6_IGNLU|nr:hypothetical protein ILUMI_04661 [Ignelater luminosus]
MTTLLDNYSVIKEINKANESIKAGYERVALLERKLDDKVLPPEKQEKLRRELLELRKLLRTNEKLLSKLHSHNRKSFMLAIFIAFICFTLYMLYVLIVGLDF